MEAKSNMQATSKNTKKEGQQAVIRSSGYSCTALVIGEGRRGGLSDGGGDTRVIITGNADALRWGEANAEQEGRRST